MLVERDRQLAELGQMYAETVEGRGRVAVVRGPVASGKTELVHAFAERAVAAGARFVEAVALRSEQAVRFGVLGQLFRGLAEQGGDRSAVSRTAWHGGAKPVSPDVIHRLGLDLLETVEGSAQPYVIAVDDLHHADRDSLRFLASLIRRLRGARVLFLLTESVHPLWTTLSSFEAELPGEPHCCRITVAPLSGDGVRALLAGRFDPQTAARLAPSFHELSGGNPLLVHALADDHESGMAEAFGQSLLGTFHRYGPSAVRLARTAAALDRPVDSPLVREVSGLDAETVTRATAALEASGVLVDSRLRHEIVRTAILDTTAPSEVADVQWAASKALYQAGAPAAEVAELLMAAQRAGAGTVPVLHEAAEEAMASGQVERARDYLRLALQGEESVDERQRAATTALLARVGWLTDPLVGIRHARTLDPAVRAGHLTVRDALVLVGSRLWFGEFGEARAALHRAAVMAPPAGREDAHLRAYRLWTRSAHPDGAGSHDGDGEPLAAHETVRSPVIEAAAMVHGLLVRDHVDPEAVTAAERALRPARLDQQTVALQVVALLVLVSADRLAIAGRWADRALARTRAPGLGCWHALFSAVRADIALRHGDLPLAGYHARAALDALAPQSWGVMVGYPVGILLQVAVAQGDWEQAAAQLDVPVPDAMFESPIAVHYLRARGRYHAATRDPRKAVDDITAAAELMRGWGMGFSSLIPWRTDLAMAYLRLGDRDRAAALAREQLHHCRPEETRQRGVALRILALCREPGDRIGLLTRAVTALRAADARLDLAYTLRDLAAEHEARGRSADGRRVYDQAQALADECGIGDTSRPPRVDHPTVAPVSDVVAPRPAPLSEAEQRVAVLAAEGFSNRQIAQKLFVTVSTVEQHLTRVYRKLRVSRRTELARRLPVHTAVG